VYARRLGVLRLFQNDLDDLVRLLGERTGKVGIQAGDAVAAEPADLRDATSKELQAVQIVTSEPAIVIRLGSQATASTTDDSDSARATVDDIYLLLNARRSQGAFWVGLWREGRFFFLLVAVLESIGALLALVTRDPTPLRVFALWALLLFLPIIFGPINFRSTGYCVIVPRLRSEQRGLSRETARELVSGLIGALIGAAVAIIALVQSRQ